jgi:hypothetical protein
MDEKKHVLIVTNSLSTVEIQQVNKTFNQMQSQGIKLKVSLLYVKPYFPTCYFHIPSMIALSEDFEEEAKETLKEIGEKLGTSVENQWIATGRIKSETLKIAATLGVDFILSSSSIHRELTQAFNFKRSRFALPIETADSIAA